MRSRRSMSLVLLAVATLAGAIIGCTPQMPASGSPAILVSGCHDQVGAPDAYDVAYSGEPSEYGNLSFFTSTDGSCSGRNVATSMASSTLIVANSSANADFLCRNLLAAAARPGTFDQLTGPWSPGFGGTAFICVG